MNRNHSLIDQVAELLAEQGIHLFTFEEGSFFGYVTVEGGVDISLRIHCTCARPSLIRVTGTLPMAVPAPLHDPLVKVLNAINQSVPCGGFTINPADGRVSLENSAMIPDGDHPGPQLRWLLFLNGAIMRRQSLTIMRLATGALAECDALALVTQESGDSDISAEPDSERFRWN